MVAGRYWRGRPTGIVSFCEDHTDTDKGEGILRVFRTIQATGVAEDSAALVILEVAFVVDMSIPNLWVLITIVVNQLSLRYLICHVKQ